MVESNVTDLTLEVGSTICKLLGIPCPPAATLGVVVDAYRSHRSKKHYKRLEQLDFALDQRLRHIEYELDCSEKIDLFEEIIEKAITDEDGDKIAYYAALVEYVVLDKHQAYEIRLLGNALKQLTLPDLKAFVHFGKKNVLPHSLPNYLKDTFWNRVEMLGLFTGGDMKHSTNISILGKTLINICRIPSN